MESIHVERLGMSDDAWITSVNQQLRLIFVFQGIVFKHVEIIRNMNLQIGSDKLSPPCSLLFK